METPFVSCRCVELHAEGVEVLRSSPDGKWMAVARSNASVEIYDVASWHLKLRLRDEGCRSIRSLLWLPLTPAAAAAAAGGREETAAAEAAAAAHHHSLLLNGSSSSADGGDEEQQMLLLQQQQQQQDPNLFDWTLVSAGLHGAITVWDLRLQQISVESSSFGGAVFSLSAAAAGVSPRCFAAACDDGRIRLFQLEGAAGTSVAAAAAAGRHSARDTEAAAAAMTNREAEDEEGPLTLTLRATLPKTNGRLLSVCWYKPSLLFAGNANSTIYRFSAAAATGGGSHFWVFAADGKMLLQQPRQQQQQPREPQQQGDDHLAAGSKGSSGKANSAAATDHREVLIWSLHAVPRLQLLLSGDSSGCVTVWSLPACVALQRLQLHAADVLNVEAVVIGPPPSFSPRLSSFSSRSTNNNAAAAGSATAAVGSAAAAAGRQKESSCSVVVVSAGVDGKLATATNSNPEGGGAWVLGPARYPHRTDIRGLTLLQHHRWSSSNAFKSAAAASSRLAAAASLADPAAAAAAAAAVQGGLLATLAAVTGAVDGTISLNEKLLGHSSAAELKKLPTPVATTPLAKGFRPRVRVAAATGAAAAGTAATGGRGSNAATAVLFACTDEGLHIWTVDEALRSCAATSTFVQRTYREESRGRDNLKMKEEDYFEEENTEEKEKQQQVVKLLRVCLREGLHPRCGDIAPDAALLVAGSRLGLHFFGLDLQELHVFDVEGGAACSGSRGVTAVRFLSPNVICFCELYFPERKYLGLLKKKKKKHKQGREVQPLPDLLLQQQGQQQQLDTPPHAQDLGEKEEGGGRATITGAADSRREKGEEAVTAAAAEAAAAAAALEAAWEAVAGGSHRGGRGGAAAAAGEVAAFRISIVNVWTGKHLGHCGPLAHPVSAFEVSADGQLLACCLTSGALLLLDACTCVPIYFLPAFPSLGTAISCCTFLYAAPSSNSSSSGDGDACLCLFAPSNHYTLLRIHRLSEDGAGAAADAGAADGRSSSSNRSSLVASKKLKMHAQQAEAAAAVPAAGLWLPRLSRRFRLVPRACLPASGGPILSAVWLGLPLPAASAAAAAPRRQLQQRLMLPGSREEMLLSKTQQQQRRRRTAAAGAAGASRASEEEAENGLMHASSSEEEHEELQEEERREAAEEEEQTEKERGKKAKRRLPASEQWSANAKGRGGAAAAAAAACPNYSAASAAEASVLYCLTASALCGLPPLLRRRRSSSRRRRRRNSCRLQQCVAVAAQQQHRPKAYVDLSSESSSQESTARDHGEGDRHGHSPGKLQQQHSSSSGSSGSSCSEEEADDKDDRRLWRNSLSSPLSPGHRGLEASPLASAVAAAVRSAAAAPRSFTTFCAPPLYAAAVAAAAAAAEGGGSFGSRSGRGRASFAAAAAAAALPRLPPGLRSMLLHSSGLQQRGRYLLLAHQAKQLQQLLANVAETPLGKRKRMRLQVGDHEGMHTAEKETADGEKGVDQKGGDTEQRPEEAEEEEDEEAIQKNAQMMTKKQRNSMKKQAKVSCEALQRKQIDAAIAATFAVEGSPQASLLSTTCSSPSSLGAAAANGDATEGLASNSSSSKKKKKIQREALSTEEAFAAALQSQGDSGGVAAAAAAGGGLEEVAALDGNSEEEAEEEGLAKPSGFAACEASQASSNTTCSSSSEKKKKRRSSSGSSKSLEQEPCEQQQQQQETLSPSVKLQQPCGSSSSIEDKWYTALSRPSVIRVNTHQGFLALEMFAWPGSSGKKQGVFTAAEYYESQGEEDREEEEDFKNGRKPVMRDERKNQKHSKGRKATTGDAAFTMPTLVLVEAFSGAISLPENMPAPFNRKRYGT